MDGRNYNKNQRRRVAPKKSRKSAASNAGGLKSMLKTVDGSVDYIFLGIVVLLLTYGILMLYSASSARAYAKFGNSFYFLVEQLKSLAVGAFAMWVFSRVDYHKLGGKIALLFYGGCAFLLLLVLTPLGTEANGATRWVFGFQPSELAKVSIIILFAYTLGSPQGQKDIKSVKYSFFPHIIMLGIFVGLIYFEPHMSCIILMSITACLIMFVAGTPIKHFLALAAVAVPAVIIAIIKEPYRLARIVNMNPFEDMQGGGWQVAQSLYAIGSGGIFGVGIGNSRQKFQSLPEPHNDFIFSVICEELGLIGAILVAVLFILFLRRGIQIAISAPDLFGTLLCIGFVGINAIQAAFNIAVVTATIPNTGIPMPFFSYGGTALVITMAEMGIVLNVSRQSKRL